MGTWMDRPLKKFTVTPSFSQTLPTKPTCVVDLSRSSLVVYTGALVSSYFTATIGMSSTCWITIPSNVAVGSLIGRVIPKLLRRHFGRIPILLFLSLVLTIM